MANVQQKDYLYENPPLIEVIVEVRWSLVPISVLKGAALDPFFNSSSEKFSESMREMGFGVIEHLVPSEFPIEMMAGKPFVRYRPNNEEWPLYQLGPGLFTCNIVPPYQGWSEFKSTLHAGVKALFDAFPFGASNIPSIVELELRYIDGFDYEDGFDGYTDLVENGLGVSVDFPKGLGDLSKDEQVKLSSLEFALPANSPDGAVLSTRIAPGKNGEKKVAVAEFRVSQSGEDLPNTMDEIIDWFDHSHQTLNLAFEGSITDKLREKFGKKIVVQNAGGE